MSLMNQVLKNYKKNNSEDDFNGKNIKKHLNVNLILFFLYFYKLEK